MKNRVVLIGGFHKAMALGNSLVKSGYIVTLINENYEDCLQLSQNDNFRVICGDGTQSYILEDAEVEENDIAIALTKEDEDNLVVCELCKKKFGLKRTISLVNDPKKTELFYKLGIDSVVCAVNMIAGILEQQTFMDTMGAVLPLGQGNICVSQIRICENAPSVEKKIWELDLPHDVIIGCILRGEYNIVPRGDTRILSGDIVVLISSQAKQIEATRVLTGRC